MMKRLDFVGTLIGAEEVTWKELNDINDKAKDFMEFLGNYYCDDDGEVYALFVNVDDRERYCVKL